MRLLISILALIPLFVSAQSADGIHTKEAIEIGGIKQWISIDATEGTHDQKGRPVLLFLHGGPGNSAMSYADKFTGELQKHFIVANWDQRESGKTAELNASDKPLTVALAESDAIEVIDYLRKRFSQEKIYLMGHSWGGFLALKIAADHPELLKACLAVSPMVHQLESERLSLKWMLDKATQENNKEALDELKRVSVPFGSGEQLYFHRSWLLKMAGRKSPSKSFVETWATKWLDVFNEGSAINFFKTAPRMECPLYFFVGRKDYQTHFKLTEDYYNFVTAPAKIIFWFDNAGHNLTTAEPARLQEIIITNILPKAGN
jgi:pimeloyl-ACP methyl ester carboxylesterase